MPVDPRIAELLAEAEKIDPRPIEALSVAEARARGGSVNAAPALPPEVVAQVVDKFVMQLEAQLADRHVSIELSEDARKWLAQKGFDPLYGARPLARVIQENIKKSLAEDILFGKLEKGGTVRIGLDKEADKLTFEIVESKSSPREETVEPVDA